MGNTQALPSGSAFDSSRLSVSNPQTSSSNPTEKRSARLAEQANRRATMAFETPSVLRVDSASMITSIASTPATGRSRRVSIEPIEHPGYQRHAATSPSSPSTPARQLAIVGGTRRDTNQQRLTSTGNNIRSDNNESEATTLLTSKPMPIRQRRDGPTGADSLNSNRFCDMPERRGRQVLGTSLSAYPFVGSPLSYSELSSVDRSVTSLTALAQPVKFPSLEETEAQHLRPGQRGRSSTSPSVMRAHRTETVTMMANSAIAPIKIVTDDNVGNTNDKDNQEPEIFKATPEDTLQLPGNSVINTRPMDIPGQPRSTSGHLALSTSAQDSQAGSCEAEMPSNEQLVSTIITWNGGGNVVYVTGTFNRWRRKIKMLKSSPSDEDFTTVLHLPVGTHQLKFIVDDEWRCSEDLATAPDINGNLVNYVSVDPDMLTENMGSLPDASEGGAHVSFPSSPEGSYTSHRPAYLDLALQPHPITLPNEATDTTITSTDASSIATEAAAVRRMQPPTLPPHLEHVLLNTVTVSRDDESALPTPQHVELNHLYACSIRDGVMAMATTKRYREKYITTVYYKPVFH
ncbi:hypothetical protein BDF19DRAFT_445821 [Syncephalis fuscata]|nr:hypothetical protein BDF19DRAFT_445821 [Syncephalis fuscata]